MLYLRAGCEDLQGPGKLGTGMPSQSEQASGAKGTWLPEPSSMHE